MNRYMKEKGRPYPWWRHPDAVRTIHRRATARLRGFRRRLKAGEDWQRYSCAFRREMEHVRMLRKYLEPLP